MRRRRQPVVKLDLYRKVKWFVSNGLATSHISAKLGVSRTTVRYWVKLMDRDHEFQQLRRRVLRLPDRLRDQLVTDLTERRAA